MDPYLESDFELFGRLNQELQALLHHVGWLSSEGDALWYSNEKLERAWHLLFQELELKCS